MAHNDTQNSVPDASAETLGGTELPLFPTTAPPVFSDPSRARALFQPVFAALAEMVVVDPAHLDRATTCEGFTVEELRAHVLAWLQFFATSLGYEGEGAAPDRIDPETWALGGDDPAAIVRAAAQRIDEAMARGVHAETVTMAQARMAGDGVLAMALGEYLIHGWDLASSTGRAYVGADDAAEPALAFLQSTVAPEYRGPDSGFYDAEVPAPPGASAFERLLCFAGRAPSSATVV